LYVGAMKVKRFKPLEVDPDYRKIDRIINEITDEHSQKLVLVKWCKLPYESSTYELVEDVERCENELKAYRDRKRMKHMRLPLDWRPAKENQLRFEESKTYKNGNTLRSYQVEGVNWLLNRWYYKQSCIMADEMGLDKTVQSVTFVDALFSEFDYNAPALIVSVRLCTGKGSSRTGQTQGCSRIMDPHQAEISSTSMSFQSRPET